MSGAASAVSSRAPTLTSTRTVALTLALSLVGGLSGCGGPGAANEPPRAPSSSATHPSAPSPSATQPTAAPPAREKGAPAPKALPGYTYSPAPQEFLDTLDAQDGAPPGLLVARTAVVVEAGPSPAASLALWRVAPGLAGNDTVAGLILDGVEASLADQGAEMSTRDIGGRDVVVGTTPDAVTFAWVADGVLAMAFADDASAGEAFVAAYVASA